MTTQLCIKARARYGPGVPFRMSDFERHAKKCAECTAHQLAIKRQQRAAPMRYSRDFPLTGDVHKYLLIVPHDLWDAFVATLGGKSVRSELLTMMKARVDRAGRK